jgi:5-methylcytosine-specific restriction endonuclease McrA
VKDFVEDVEMENQDLHAVSNEVLFSTMKTLRDKECQTTADAIRYLAEIERRGIYRDAGFSSLFTYLTIELGYSEGSASRRCRAVKCYQDSPESVYELLRSGRVTLTSLAEVTPVITSENREAVLKAVEGSSRREAQEVAASFGAPVQSRKPTVKARKVIVEAAASAPGLFDERPASEPVTEERYEFNFEITPEVKALFDEARAFLGHHDVAVVFEKLIKNYLRTKKGSARKETKPTLTDKGTATPVNATPGKPRKAIPASVKREVLKRDNCQCTFTAADGRRCAERVSLHFDHRIPVAVGGRNEAENLRLLCPQHNQLEAERYFGPAFVRNIRQRSSDEERR